MLICSIILIIIKLSLDYGFEFNGPFYLHSREKYYQTKQSKLSELEIITLNQSASSEFALEINSKPIKTFKLPTKPTKYKVLIFYKDLNPYINLPNEISVNFLCKFFYPVALTGDSDFVRCSIFSLSLTTLPSRILLGSCKLNLQATSCLCALKTTFLTNRELETKKNSIQLLAEVSKCNNCQQHDLTYDSKWQKLASTNLTIELKKSENLIWYESFYNETSKIGLLIGMPRNSIQREIGFEMPVKLIFPSVFTLPLTLLLRFPSIEHVSLNYENKSEHIESVDEFDTSNKDASLLVLRFFDNITHDILVSSPIIVMKLTIKFAELSFFHVSAEVHDISQVSKFHDVGNIVNPRRIFVSVVGYDKIIIPVIDRPLIVQNFDNHMEARTIKKELLDVYFLYNDNLFDVSYKLQCQSFNKSKLKCPSSMDSYTEEQSRYIVNKKSLEWSMEVKIDNWKSILDIRPQIINENNWEILISDYVLNKIYGWRGPENRFRGALLKDDTCNLLYQITSIKIFRKVKMYNDFNQNPVEKILDITKYVDILKLKITPAIASVHKYGNNLVLQGIKEGDFKLDVTDDKGNVVISKSLQVLGDIVYVRDIEVSCHPSIELTSESYVFSFLVNIHHIKMSLKKFNKSENCVISIDLIFSDNSRCNLFTIPSNQFFVRFITNREVLEVFDFQDMLYNYSRFNNNTSFYVEIIESKMCSRPQTVIKKLIHLEPPQIIPSSKKNSISSSTTVTSSNIKITTSESQPHSLNSSIIQKFVFIFVGLFAIVVVVVLCKLIRDCIYKKKLRCQLSKRRQSCTKDNENNNGALPFPNDYPPLLPSPGPQVGVTDNSSVTLSSPQSFWCLNHNNKSCFSKKSLLQPFSRPYSIKDHSRKDTHKYAQPCPPLRWIHKILPEEVDMNIYSSQDPLDISPISSIPCNGAPMCWSVTQMEGDQSSGIGSLMTNMDDFLKDPYEARDKFSKLSEIPRVLVDNKETVYEPI